MWRERVKREVEEIIREWNKSAQVLHLGHIRDLTDKIVDAIPSPDATER